MPQMGESIAEATISKWLKQVGDKVEQDEVILQISTDKVDSDIPSPTSGVIAELLFNEGDVVPVKQKIAVIDTEASGGSRAASTPAATSTAAPKPAVVTPTQSQAAISEPVRSDPVREAAPAISARIEQDDEGGKFYSPLVRSLAEKHGITVSELEAISGSGQGGRVTKQDLLAHVESRGGKSTPAASAAKPTQEPARPAPAARPAERVTTSSEPASLDFGPDGMKVVPMDNMRKLIAEHMVRSKQTSPHVYSVQEVDCSKIAKWRTVNKKLFESKEGFGLSYTPFFLEAAVQGLVKFPLINSSVDGNKIIMKRHINLGCAVALGTSGLIVPVIKRAEERNLVGIARALNDLALRARNKKLLPEEVMDGTFTVTNPGVFGTMIGTPIINQPQVAILCLGAIKKRPVVVEDMLAIREICYLTLSYDHRIVDGSLSGQYLAFIREYLENWDMGRALY